MGSTEGKARTELASEVLRRLYKVPDYRNALPHEHRLITALPSDKMDRVFKLLRKQDGPSSIVTRRADGALALIHVEPVTEPHVHDEDDECPVNQTSTVGMLLDFLTFVQRTVVIHAARPSDFEFELRQEQDFVPA